MIIKSIVAMALTASALGITGGLPNHAGSNSVVTTRPMVLAHDTGLAGMITPVHWSDSRTTTGAAASCTMRSWDGTIRNKYADISCDISDTAGDSHSVYVEWWQDGFGKVRMNNHDGVGHTTHSYDSRQGSDSFQTLYWRVCRDVQFGHDNCSSTVSHRTF
jgi:hypothetical protein